MNTEIEKMYENAGVLKECLSPCYINKTWRKTHDCPNCDNRENYPPFTAEKQLKLIKWFMHSRHFSPVRFNARWVVDDIASHINFLWQNLTEKEKQQVKGILE